MEAFSKLWLYPYLAILAVLRRIRALRLKFFMLSLFNALNGLFDILKACVDYSIHFTLQKDTLFDESVLLKVPMENGRGFMHVVVLHTPIATIP